MLHILAIAPSFLALHRSTDNKLTASAFLSAIKDLHTISLETDWFRIFISSRTIERLYSHGFFPVRETIQSLINTTEQQAYYAANDFIRMFNKIVDRATDSECCLGIDDILFDESFSIRPHPRLSPAYQGLNDCESDFYGYCAVAASQNIPHDAKIVPYSSEDVETTDVSAKIICALPSHLNLDGAQINHTLPTIALGKSFFDTVDASYIWRNATSSADLYLGILLAAYQQQNENLAWQSLSGFCIGSEFINSLKRNSSFGEAEFSNQVLSVCRQIVAGEADKISQPFRKNRSAHAAQRVRQSDGARAYRTHVTKGNEGLRLMHWLHADGVIELANVGPKSELIVESGVPEARFRLFSRTT